MKHILAILILLLPVYCAAQTQKIGGKVTDSATGEPVEFASVVAEPSKQFAVTDIHGRWNLNLAPGNYRIIISFVGYTTDTVAVRVPHTGDINVKLTETATELREVVITSREGHGMTSASRIDRSAM